MTNWTEEQLAAHLAKQRPITPTTLIPGKTRAERQREAMLGVSETGPAAQTITLPYPPQANNFKSAIVVKGRAVMILTKAARAYKSEAAEIVTAAGLRRLTGPICVTIRAYRPRRVGDLDNLIKLSIDSLSGHAFTDDAQVVQIVASRHDDKLNPRVEIEVKELPL